MILNLIYKRNPLSFNLIPLNHSIDNNLTLVIPISLTLLFNAYVLLFIYSTISLNSFIVTTYKSSNPKLSTILMSLSCDIVVFNIIVIGTLKGMVLILLSYYNCGSECITKPCAI